MLQCKTENSICLNENAERTKSKSEIDLVKKIKLIHLNQDGVVLTLVLFTTGCL